MDDYMNDRRSEADPERVERIDQFLNEAWKYSTERLMQANQQLSKSNFIINGAASVAVLAYIGATNDPATVLASLFLFVSGVVTSLAEQRAYQKFYSSAEIAIDSNRERWIADQARIGEILTPLELDPKPTRFIIAASWTSQILFVLGVIAAAAGFYLKQ